MNTNPFRFRDEMSAQELLDCGFEECFTLQRKEKEALNLYER